MSVGCGRTASWPGTYRTDPGLARLRRAPHPHPAWPEPSGVLNRLTGQPIRRYERDRPGELIHVDVRKLGRIPDGGGHKVLGRRAGRAPRSGVGFDDVHSAVDDHSRLAYSEVHADEKAFSCAAFLRRAAAFFTTCGIDRIERVLTDNAWPYRKGFAWRQALAEFGEGLEFGELFWHGGRRLGEVLPHCWSCHRIPGPSRLPSSPQPAWNGTRSS